MAAVNPVSGAGGSGQRTQPIALYLLLLFALALLLGMVFDAPIISRLTEAAAARGLITFTISVATIGLAFTLVYQAFYADTDASTERFRRAREVFTGMMGILGTIVGFYFGSTEGSGTRLELAEIEIVGTELRTHVNGGVSPYRYSISSDPATIAAVDNEISNDGWIAHELTGLPAQGTLTVEVTDHRGQKTKRELKLPTTKAGGAASSASEQPAVKNEAAKSDLQSPSLPARN
jgi:hypothetical protein